MYILEGCNLIPMLSLHKCIRAFRYKIGLACTKLHKFIIARFWDILRMGGTKKVGPPLKKL